MDEPAKKTRARTPSKRKAVATVAPARPTATLYYQDRDFLITSSKAKSPRKTYRIDKIEKISLRRDPFFIMLALSVFTGLFLMRFGFALNIGPFFFFLVVMIGAYVASYFGMLYVTSKAVSELAFVGLYGRLAEVREAIEKAMHKDDVEDGLAADPEDDDDE